MDRLSRLLLDAQAGDREALRRFVVETHHEVTIVCRHLGDRDNADDLVQQTYERAIRSLHRFRATGPARHWLLTIARRTCVDATRGRIRRRAVEQRVIGLARDDLTAPAAERAACEQDDLLDTLGPDQRAAFVLTQLTGLRYDEAADVLGVPIGTIRSRVARAREQLVGELDRRRHDDPATREPGVGRRRPG